LNRSPRGVVREALLTGGIPTDAVAEAAVVGVTDELTGQAVNAFVSLKDGNEHNEQIRKDLVLQVRKSIGPFAAPKVRCFQSVCNC
jgi:acyl-coenzyme A synthetase/AMP-(fatty) acid ligase